MKCNNAAAAFCRAVFLAGLASLQQICNDSTTQYGNQGGAPGGAGAGGTGNPNSLQQIQGQSLNTAGLLNVFGKYGGSAAAKLS